MLNPPRLRFGTAHISLTLVGLMWVLPFLYPHHAYPVTTFYQEWLTALLGVLAMTLLLTGRFWQAPQVPGIVLLPIGMMMLLLLQFMFGQVEHFDQVLLLSLYFLFAALLMLLGQHLRAELGLPCMTTVLAAFLLLGAELSTLAGILQHYRWHTFLDGFITVKVSAAVFGNIAQPNHFANYIALGLISLGLLHTRFVGRAWLTALLATPMLFVLVLSASRSAWLYLSFILLLAWLWQRKDRALRPLFIYTAALWLGYLAMHGAVQLPWLQGSSGSITAAERLFGEVNSGGIRLHLWREAGLIFARFPLLGAGFGQFAYQHLLLAAELRNPAVTGLYNNAHNIVLQLAAETGLAGLGVLGVTLGLWAWQAFVRRAQFTRDHWWGYAVLAVLAIHSLLEYPLWYAYFIGIAAFVLGAFDSVSYKLELRSAGRLSVAIILVLGAASLWQGLQSYRHLENALSSRHVTTSGVAAVTRVRDELLATQDYPLFGSYGQLFIAGMLEPNEEKLAQKLTLNEHALRFIPTATLSYHQALLLAWSGQPQAARAMLEQAIWAYPAEYERAREELTQLATHQPGRFQPLLEFATLKYKEYRSAIPAR
ncbi:MAG: Wzy polymerase domain-containing protein [Sideroxyarcus sp.]|nr:Wzy polymerase domain-containing protein [Sideroxyarcus sp.]